MGKIKAINISNLDGENTFYINQAILHKNKGIVNDRYYKNFKIKLIIIRRYVNLFFG